MNTNIPQKSLICIAQHIRAYVEQCKNEDLADFAEPCSRCQLNVTCDKNAYRHLDHLVKKTEVLITPLRSKKDYLELLKKQDTH